MTLVIKNFNYVFNIINRLPFPFPILFNLFCLYLIFSNVITASFSSSSSSFSSSSFDYSQFFCSRFSVSDEDFVKKSTMKYSSSTTVKLQTMPEDLYALQDPEYLDYLSKRKYVNDY